MAPVAKRSPARLGNDLNSTALWEILLQSGIDGSWYVVNVNAAIWCDVTRRKTSADVKDPHAVTVTFREAKGRGGCSDCPLKC